MPGGRKWYGKNAPMGVNRCDVNRFVFKLVWRMVAISELAPTKIVKAYQIDQPYFLVHDNKD